MKYHLRDIEHVYAGRPVLNIPELKIEPAGVLGLVGANGSGKSTLLRLLAFLETPSRGLLEFSGAVREVSLLLQKPVLLKRKVYQNVAYGLEIRGRRSELPDRVNQALATVGLKPEEFARRHWYELSGGEAQRVALASRLAFRPSVLLLDEPTANVDAASARLIRGVILRLKKEGRTTLIIASHDEAWLNSLGGRVLRLKAGRLLGSGAVNLLPGPWEAGSDGLWCCRLGDGQKILAVDKTAEQAMLAPGDIVLARKPLSEISARNQLAGCVESLTAVSGKIEIRVSLADFCLTTSLTPAAVNDLKLLPGSPVQVVFKAGAVTWS